MACEIIIGEIKKNHYEYIRFILAEDSKRKQYLVIKMFFRNGAGRMIPTDRWLSFGVKRLEIAIELMKKAREQMVLNIHDDSLTATEAAMGDTGDTGEGG